MTFIDPVLAISLFLTLTVLGVLLFRPDNGYFWRIKHGLERNEKVVIEDILKQLYHFEYEGQKTTLNNLAGALNIRHRALVKLITIMESRGLLTTLGKEFNLNPSGRDYALKIIRAHRLWEKYLSDETGVDRLEWHKEADRMEHFLTVEDVNKLAVHLGSPRFDPHGDPIPTDTGEIVLSYGKPLSSFPVDILGRIMHIEDEPKAIYEQIIAEDLHIGAQIRIVESNKYRIKFYSEGEEHTLAPVVAANINVMELSRQEKAEANVCRLSSLKKGEEAKVYSISRECRGANRRRLLDLGFVPGTEVSIDITGPLDDPVGYMVHGAVIAIRNDQADLVLIERSYTK